MIPTRFVAATAAPTKRNEANNSVTAGLHPAPMTLPIAHNSSAVDSIALED